VPYQLQPHIVIRPCSLNRSHAAPQQRGRGEWSPAENKLADESSDNPLPDT
jgi:hypothetical protein